jgi:hypothetical protein
VAWLALSRADGAVARLAAGGAPALAPDLDAVRLVLASARRLVPAAEGGR